MWWAVLVFLAGTHATRGRCSSIRWDWLQSKLSSLPSSVRFVFSTHVSMARFRGPASTWKNEERTTTTIRNMGPSMWSFLMMVVVIIIIIIVVVVVIIIIITIITIIMAGISNTKTARSSQLQFRTLFVLGSCANRSWLACAVGERLLLTLERRRCVCVCVCVCVCASVWVVRVWVVRVCV